MPLDGLHGERDRAESFGSFAEDYDRYRPGYPSALIDELVAGVRRMLSMSDAGPGRSQCPLMERGVRARDRAGRSDGRGSPPPPGAGRGQVPFESWDPAGRTYDLLTAGHSWHWVDPVVGLAKAAAVVVPGGTVALFWNYHVVLEESLVAAFGDAYRAHAPELTVVGHDPSGSPDTDPFHGSKELGSHGSVTYRWPRILDADEWTSMLATFSDHARLGESRLRDLQSALRQAIEQAGGVVRSECGTYVWKARVLRPLSTG